MREDQLDQMGFSEKKAREKDTVDCRPQIKMFELCTKMDHFGILAGSGIDGRSKSIAI